MPKTIDILWTSHGHQYLNKLFYWICKIVIKRVTLRWFVVGPPSPNRSQSASHAKWSLPPYLILRYKATLYNKKICLSRHSIAFNIWKTFVNMMLLGLMSRWRMSMVCRYSKASTTFGAITRISTENSEELWSSFIGILTWNNLNEPTWPITTTHLASVRWNFDLAIVCGKTKTSYSSDQRKFAKRVKKMKNNLKKVSSLKSLHQDTAFVDSLVITKVAHLSRKGNDEY